MQEKGERTAKIEGLREVGYEKIGGRWMMERGKMKDGEGKMKDGEGAADRKVWKDKTERVTRQYFSWT